MRRPARPDGVQTIAVRVRALLFLREKLAARGIACRDAEVPLEEGAHITDLMAVWGLTEREVEAAFVNHRAMPLDTELRDGDHVVLLPPGTPGPHRYLLGIAHFPERRE